MKKIHICIVFALSILLAVLTACSDKETTAENKDIKLCSASDSVKSAALLYTGEEYFIGDFVLSGSIVTVSEGSGTKTEKYDNLRHAPEEYFEVFYRYTYGKTGCQGIEILWDTDKVISFDINLHSIDGAVEITFGEDGVFYRKAENGEKGIDCSGNHYFKENEKKPEIIEEIDYDAIPYAEGVTLYDNPKMDCQENEAAAYINFYDTTGNYRYNYIGEPCSLKAENAIIKGEGDYVVSLTCDTPVQDVSYAALCVENGENIFPGYSYLITAITLDGEYKSCAESLTESEDGITSYTYIYYPVVKILEDNARSGVGYTDDSSYVIIPGTRIKDWTEMKVYFTVVAPGNAVDFSEKTEEIRLQLNG